MKSFTSFYSLFLILFISLASCSEEKETPEPLSQAVFSQDRNVVELNEVVTFSNASLNATRYEWDFGNGQTSTAANVTVSYPKPGTYTVSLISYNNQNIASTTNTTVKVGERYLTGIKVNSINFSKKFGGAWDVNDGPDLILWFGESSRFVYNNNLDLGADYTPAMLPKSISFEQTIKFSNEPWGFGLYDDDPQNQVDPVEQMAGWIGNPYLMGQKNYATGIGSFKLVDGLFDLDLIFEIR